MAGGGWGRGAARPGAGPAGRPCSPPVHRRQSGPVRSGCAGEANKQNETKEAPPREPPGPLGTGLGAQGSAGSRTVRRPSGLGRTPARGPREDGQGLRTTGQDAGAQAPQRRCDSGAGVARGRMSRFVHGKGHHTKRWLVELSPPKPPPLGDAPRPGLTGFPPASGGGPRRHRALIHGGAQTRGNGFDGLVQQGGHQVPRDTLHSGRGGAGGQGRHTPAPGGPRPGPPASIAPLLLRDQLQGLPEGRGPPGPAWGGGRPLQDAGAGPVQGGKGQEACGADRAPEQHSRETTRPGHRARPAPRDAGDVGGSTGRRGDFRGPVGDPAVAEAFVTRAPGPSPLPRPGCVRCGQTPAAGDSLPEAPCGPPTRGGEPTWMFWAVDMRFRSTAARTRSLCRVRAMARVRPARGRSRLGVGTRSTRSRETSSSVTESVSGEKRGPGLLRGRDPRPRPGHGQPHGDPDRPAQDGGGGGGGRGKAGLPVGGAAAPGTAHSGQNHSSTGTSCSGGSRHSMWYLWGGRPVRRGPRRVGTQTCPSPQRRLRLGSDRVKPSQDPTRPSPALLAPLRGPEPAAPPAQRPLLPRDPEPRPPTGAAPAPWSGGPGVSCPPVNKLSNSKIFGSDRRLAPCGSGRSRSSPWPEPGPVVLF